MDDKEVGKLRCSDCPHRTIDYCDKLKHFLRSTYAMLYHGGVVGDSRYPCQCGIDQAKLEKVRK